jgi:hypothetical protein
LRMLWGCLLFKEGIVQRLNQSDETATDGMPRLRERCLCKL